MNTLVVNLTRFGDLLQSAAALSGLAARGKVALVCLDNFKPAAAFLPHLDRVFPLPGGKLLAALHTQDGRAVWKNALADLAVWADGIRAEFQPDYVCNLTPTLSARLLSRYLAGQKDVQGFGLDTLGFGVNSTPWAAFMQGAAKARGVSPFNIVDLFRKVALPPCGIGATPAEVDTQQAYRLAPCPEKTATGMAFNSPRNSSVGTGVLPDNAADASLVLPPQEILDALREQLRTAAPRGTRGFVALQMGASEDRRRWPEASFAALGDQLWQTEQYCPVLLGTEGERPLADRYAALAGSPFIDLVGRTKLPQLAAALRAVALLVSNDTGTLHLASGLGVPVLGIFLATAQPWDTGPYSPGNYSLEPDLACHPCPFGTACTHDLACHTAIRPATVLALARRRLALAVGGKAEKPAPDYAGSRVWQSGIDAFGFADLQSLSGHENETRTLWLRAQRHLYRQFLDRNPATAFVPQASPPLPLAPEAARALAQECRNCLTMLDALQQQGQLLLARPLPQVQERFMATWQRLADFFRQSPQLAALALLWREETQNSSDVQNALDLAAQYHSLLNAVLDSL